LQLASHTQLAQESNRNPGGGFGFETATRRWGGPPNSVAWLRLTLLGVLVTCAACRRSFTSEDQRFVSNVQAAVMSQGAGLEGELAAAVCAEAARLGHRRAPLLRIAPDRFRDCAGASAPAPIVEALARSRIVLATCTRSGEELLIRDDLTVFTRWPADGLEGLACVGKCRTAGCAPPCSESALVLRESVCGDAALWDGRRVPVPIEVPWPRP
jgi:hypothetical protein